MMEVIMSCILKMDRRIGVDHTRTRQMTTVIKDYADSSLGEKCYYRVLKLYTSKLPPKTRQDPKAIFYWKPREKVPLDATAAWFLIQPVGCNTLASMVKNMCFQIGVTGKTNHSLRATGATRLFKANIPEKLIQERTRHKSTDALRRYERTSESCVVSNLCIKPHVLSYNCCQFSTRSASIQWGPIYGPIWFVPFSKLQQLHNKGGHRSPIQVTC